MVPPAEGAQHSRSSCPWLATSAAVQGEAEYPLASSAIEIVVRGFSQKLKGKKADELVARLVADFQADLGAGPGSAFLQVEHLACAQLDPAQVNTKLRERRKASPTAPPASRVFPAPRALEYHFGAREIRVTSKSIRKQLTTRSAPAALPAESRLTAMLHGCHPLHEVAVAKLQARMDIDRGADRFGLFLESWRNTGPSGDESFYSALDRTAGTKESIFFYDAMLSEFGARFGGKDAKRWSQQESHDKLHQSFLTYRNYRAFVEALAYSLLLPPAQPFPPPLARYDYPAVAQGQYSLRHQVDLLLEASGGDIAAVADLAIEALKSNPLPQNLWEAGSYQPVATLGLIFRERLPELIDMATSRSLAHTDALHEQSVQSRNAHAATLAAAALAALQGGGS